MVAQKLLLRFLCVKEKWAILFFIYLILFILIFITKQGKQHKI